MYKEACCRLIPTKKIHSLFKTTVQKTRQLIIARIKNFWKFFLKHFIQSGLRCCFHELTSTECSDFFCLKTAVVSQKKKIRQLFFPSAFACVPYLFHLLLFFFCFICRKNYYHVGTHVSSLRLVDDKYFVMQYVQANKQMDKSQQHLVICCFCNQTFQSWFLLENLSLFVCCCCQLRGSRLRKLWPFKTDWHFCYKSEQETWNLLF